MKLTDIRFKEANQYVIWILLVGLALGVANFSLGSWPTLGQSLVQQLLISFTIGYGLFVVVFNLPEQITAYQKYALLFVSFVVIGVLGTEVENLTKYFLFQQGSDYLPHFNTYLFNCILTMVIGIGTYFFVHKTTEPVQELVQADIPDVSLKKIPIRQGESVQLYDLEEIIYFEAYDNYSFLFDLDGKKQLCNYSLRYLQEKLSADFLRVHRKYLINTNQIYKITPHLKGRFVIEFKDKAKSSITSSTSYTDLVKGLTKI